MSSHLSALRSRGTFRQQQSTAPQHEVLTEIEDKDVDQTAIQKYLDESQFVVTGADIKESLLLAITSIPHNEAYLNGEVVIHRFPENEISFFSLISAGTYPVDAILYLALKETKEGIFEVKGPLSIDPNEMAQLATIARGAFIGWVVQVMTRGTNPAVSSTQGNERPLPKLIKDKALNGLYNFEHELSAILSTAPLNKFPCEALLDIDLALLPPAYHKRILLSVAGTRGLRYCEISMTFQKNTSSDPKIKRAVELTSFAAQYSSDVKVGLYLHPMNSKNTHRIAKFTNKLTCAMAYSLTDKGRQDFAQKIVTKDMKAFLQDKNIFTPNSNVFFPILNDIESDFTSITVSELKAAFGLSD
jgi:hypothetical protein